MHIRLVRKALQAQPFQPFTFRLTDGRALVVKHPDYVAVSRRAVLVTHPSNDDINWIEPLMIVSIDFAAKGSRKRKPSES